MTLSRPTDESSLLTNEKLPQDDFAVLTLREGQSGDIVTDNMCLQFDTRHNIGTPNNQRVPDTSVKGLGQLLR